VRVRTEERTIAVVGTDSTDGLPGLAPVYGRVLALRDAGLSDEAIAITLGVTVEAVPALVEVALRKRERSGTRPMRAVGPAMDVARAELAALEARDEPTGARDTGEVGG